MWNILWGVHTFHVVLKELHDPHAKEKKNADSVLKSLDFFLMSLEVITRMVETDYFKARKKMYLDND